MNLRPPASPRSVRGALPRPAAGRTARRSATVALATLLAFAPPAAAQSGHHEDGRNTYGHSLVIDPWGEVLLDMGEGAGVGFADVDLSRITDVRSRVPALSHRQPVGEAVAR